MNKSTKKRISGCVFFVFICTYQKSSIFAPDLKIYPRDFSSKCGLKSIDLDKKHKFYLERIST